MDLKAEQRKWISGAEPQSSATKPELWSQSRRVYAKRRPTEVVWHRTADAEQQRWDSRDKAMEMG